MPGCPLIPPPSSAAPPEGRQPVERRAPEPRSAALSDPARVVVVRAHVPGCTATRGGEELFVVSGSVRVGDEELEAGDYLYTPPGGVHDAEAHDAVLLLVSVPEPIRS